MQKTSSISEEYEAFLRRVISVLGAETLAEMSKHQETVLGDTLADLWEENQSYEGISNEMIHGAWDMATHIYPIDGIPPIVRQMQIRNSGAPDMHSAVLN